MSQTTRENEGSIPLKGTQRAGQTKEVAHFTLHQIFISPDLHGSLIK